MRYKYPTSRIAWWAWRWTHRGAGFLSWWTVPFIVGDVTFDVDVNGLQKIFSEVHCHRHWKLWHRRWILTEAKKGRLGLRWVDQHVQGEGGVLHFGNNYEKVITRTGTRTQDLVVKSHSLYRWAIQALVKKCITWTGTWTLDLELRKNMLYPTELFRLWIVKKFLPRTRNRT